MLPTHKNRSIQQYLKCLINTCSVLIIGIGNETRVFCGKNQQGLKVQAGKVNIFFDNNQPINQYLNMADNDDFAPELQRVNPHLNIEEENCYSLLTYIDKKTDHHIGLLDG